MSDFFDDEFSAYDIDLYKLSNVKAATTDSKTCDLSDEEPMSPEIKKKRKEESEELGTNEEEKQEKEEGKTPPKEEEERKADDEEAKRIMAQRQEELEARHNAMNIGGKKKLGKEDVEQMIAQQEENTNNVNTLLEMVRRMADPDNSKRKPKGLIVTLQQLEKVTCVFKATKALLELYVEMDAPPLYETLDNCGLSTAATNAQRQLVAHMPTMHEGFKSIEAMMNDYFDRPAANLRMRIIKGQAFVILAETTNQAKALAQVIESFPIENGSLLPQCLIAEKGDYDNMTAFDSTLLLAETIQVLTKDALTMVEAIKKNDTKTISTLQKNLVEYQTVQ